MRRKSSAALLHLACMEEKEARERLSALLEKCYGSEAPVSIQQLHPATSISSEKIFDVWRASRGTDRLVLCTTGKCTAESRALAHSLRSPRIAVVDSELLVSLFAEHPEELFPSPCEKGRRALHITHVFDLVLNRKNAPRCLLFSFSLLMMYIFSGSFPYLAASLALLFIVFIQLRHAPRPSKLF